MFDVSSFYNLKPSKKLKPENSENITPTETKTTYVEFKNPWTCMHTCINPLSSLGWVMAMCTLLLGTYLCVVSFLDNDNNKIVLLCLWHPLVVSSRKLHACKITAGPFSLFCLIVTNINAGAITLQKTAVS